MQVIKIHIYALAVIGFCLLSCKDEHKEITESAVTETQNSKLFFNENLNIVLNDYIEHLLNQENNEIQNQLVMVCASLDGSDTLISFSTSKYLGEFPVGSNIDWCYMGEVGNHEIFIGDQTPHLLENSYNMSCLGPYSASNELVPNYQNYDFPNSSWKFKLRGGKLE